MSNSSVEISQLRAVFDEIRMDAFLTLLHTALYCFLACATFIAIFSLLRDGIRSLPQKLNLAAITVMFCLTTVYTVVNILETWADYDIYVTNFDANMIRVGGTLEVAIFGINVILGDAIILWRAITIWSWQKRILYPSVFLLCATLALWVVANIAGGANIAIPASLATSLWATAVVSIKAWQRRSMLRKSVAIMSRHSALENVFNLLTESGIVFTILWAITLVAGEMTDELFANVMTIIMIISAPLYPTMIVILVAQNKTPITNQLTTIEEETKFDPDHRDLLDRDDEAVMDLTLSELA